MIKKPDTSFFKGSIHARLLSAFVLIVLLPVIVITGATTFVRFRGISSQVIQQLDSVATLKEAQVSNWLHELQLDLSVELENNESQNIIPLLQAAPQSHEFKAAYKRLASQLQKMIRQRKRLEELFLLDRQGKVVLSTQTMSVGEYRGLQTYAKEGLERAAAHVQTLSFSPTSEHVNTIVIVQPVLDKNGHAWGVFAGRASFAALSEVMLERAGLGNTGETYLVGANNALLTNPRFPGYEPGKKYVHSYGATRAIREHANGSGLYDDYRGVSVFGVYRWFPQLQVALLAEQDRSEALHFLYLALKIILIVAFVAVLAAVLLAIRITRSIAKPVANLAKTAVQIAEGNFHLTAEVDQTNEIGTLALAFNSMTTQLRGLITGLEQRVTELKQTSQALRESEVKYRRIVDTASEGIWMISRDFLTTFVNARMGAMLGYLPEAMLGRPITDFMFEEDYPDYQERMEARVRGMEEHYERRFRHKDGRTVWVLVSSASLLDEKNQFQGAFAMHTDITDRKKAEESLQKLTETLELRVKDRTAQIEAKNEELQRTLRVFVGRELKMVELKKRISELEKQMNLKST